MVGAALAEARDYQEALDRARIVGREQAFLIGVRVISGTLSARQAGAAYADLAETLIEALAERVEEELVHSHGRMPGGEAAILAMGKLGGREMTAGSDLDLIVVYDYDGRRRSVRRGQEPARRAILYALHAAADRRALGRDGRGLALSGGYEAQAFGEPGAGRDQALELYRLSEGLGVDLGASGALAGARRRRSRVAARGRSTKRSRRCCPPRATGPRSRRMSGPCGREIADEKGTTDIWDLKQVRGGLIDLEFIAQFLQIVSAAKHPEVLDQNTEIALAKLAAAGVLAPGDAEILVPAARLYHTLTQVLRLCLDKPFVPDEAPRALKDLLARASEMPDFATLEATLNDTLGAVHEAFDRIVA